jgi:hypothetical protein
VVLVGYVLLPALVQAASVTVSGFVWQGRYNLAAYVLLIMMTAVVVAPVHDRLPAVVRRRVLLLVAAAHAAAMFVGLMTFLRRNSVGVSATWTQLVTEPRWWPPVLGIVPWVLVITAGSLVAGAALVVAARAAHRSTDAQPADGASDPEAPIEGRGTTTAVAAGTGSA